MPCHMPLSACHAHPVLPVPSMCICNKLDRQEQVENTETAPTIQNQTNIHERIGNMSFTMHGSGMTVREGSSRKCSMVEMA